jgi:protein TonB
VERASSIEADRVVQVSPSSAEDSLLHRVEPDYPEAARMQQVQGPVVLDVHIGADGTVQEMKVVSGPPLLTAAAMDAVRQWRFQPRTVEGRQVEMQTRITLNFRLPQ